MDELQKDFKVIPLTTLELIFKDDTVFRKFVMNFENEKSLFKNIQKLDYIIALNKVMQHFIKNDPTLPKKYFEKINYLNSYYKKQLQEIYPHYSYEEYQNTPKNEIPICRLMAILSDESTFEKFLNFEEHKEDFAPISLTNYIDSFLSLERFYEENHIALPKHKMERIQDIKSHFIFETPHDEILNGSFCTIELDKNLEREVLKRVNLEENDFVIARSIYIELCKRIESDDSLPILKDEKDDNLENKKDFAAIYVSLLKKVGINAVVSFGSKRYALFSYRGVVIKADATKKENGDEISTVDDRTRVKIGLKTVGFEALNPKNDIHSAIENADKKYEKYQRVLKEERRRLEVRYRSLKQMIPQEVKNIKEMMDSISKLGINPILTSPHYTNYISSMLNANIADGLQKEIPYTICYKKKGEKYDSIVVVDLSKYCENGDTYYVFEEAKEGVLLSGLDLRNMKKRGILSIPNEKFEKNLEVKKGWNY